MGTSIQAAVHREGIYGGQVKHALIAALMLVLVACSHEPPPYESKYTPPPQSRPTQVAIIGDSFTAGTDLGGQGHRSWAYVMDKQLRKAGVADLAERIGAQGASGYTSKGNRDGKRFIDQVPDTVSRTTRLVIVFGSRNDRHYPAEQVQRDIKQTFAAVKAVAPDAMMLVIGPTWTDPEPSPTLDAVRAVLRDESAAVGATWVDPVVEGWFVDRPDLIGSDGVHPTDAGHVYLAEKIGPLVAGVLNPAPPCTTAAPFGHKQVNCPS